MRIFRKSVSAIRPTRLLQMVMIYMDFWSGRGPRRRVEIATAGLEAEMARARVRNVYLVEDA